MQHLVAGALSLLNLRNSSGFSLVCFNWTWKNENCKFSFLCKWQRELLVSFCLGWPFCAAVGSCRCKLGPHYLQKTQYFKYKRFLQWNIHNYQTKTLHHMHLNLHLIQNTFIYCIFLLFTCGPLFIYSHYWEMICSVSEHFIRILVICTNLKSVKFTFVYYLTLLEFSVLETSWE